MQQLRKLNLQFVFDRLDAVFNVNLLYISMLSTRKRLLILYNVPSILNM